MSISLRLQGRRFLSVGTKQQSRLKYSHSLPVMSISFMAGPVRAPSSQIVLMNARPASGGLGGSDSTGRGPLRGVLGALKLRNARASGVTLRLPLRQGQPSCPL